jgi:hypothetical protein
MKGRRIESEILDSLTTEDPRAVQARRDLRRLNFLMRHTAIFDDQLGFTRGGFSPRQVVELGCGDGWLLYELLSRLPKTDEPREVVLVDRHPCVSSGVVGALESSGWKVSIEETDLFEWLRRPRPDQRFDFCLVNLLLHHFRDHEIQTLFSGIQKKSRSIAACEPRRTRRSLLASHCVGLVGCNEVTRNDAVISVRAGFIENDLTKLWPRSPQWTIQERPMGLFSHYFWAKEIDL